MDNEGTKFNLSSETKIDDNKITQIAGSKTWTYFYIAWGFLTALLGTLISMTSLGFPCNIFTFVILGGIMTWLLFFTRRGRRNLLNFKNWYEQKPL
jgi:hypothetical protein